MTKRSMIAAKTGACFVAFLIPTPSQADRSANCDALHQRSAIEALGEFVGSMTLKNDGLDSCLQEESERDKHRQLQHKYAEESMEDHRFRALTEQISETTYIRSNSASTYYGTEMLQIIQGAGDKNIVELDTLENYRSIGQ